MSGPRHPGTEGNDLRPADIKFPDPDGGDGRLSLVNDVAAEFSGLAISNTQPGDMPDGGVWVNLSAEPTGIDRIQTYDESTDAFIPISANDTVVSEEEPEPEIGLLWFEPVDDGANLYASSSKRWEFLQFIPAIPDSVVDNFEDNDRGGVYGPGDDITNFYSGDIDGFTRSTSITLTGSHTLRKEPGAEYITSQPGDGLNRYPEKGDIISLFVRPDGSRPAFYFGLEDEDNWYGMRLRSSDNSFWVRTRVDGELTQVEDSVSLTSQTWYEVEFLWHDGKGVESEDTIEGKLYSLNINGDVTRDSEIASVQLTESAHANQRGIGFRSTGSEGSNNEAYYDDIRVIGQVGD